MKEGTKGFLGILGAIGFYRLFVLRAADPVAQPVGAIAAVFDVARTMFASAHVRLLIGFHSGGKCDDIVAFEITALPFPSDRAGYGGARIFVAGLNRQVPRSIWHCIQHVSYQSRR